MLPASCRCHLLLLYRCLYEIGSTPAHKLELLTHGFSERDVSQHLRRIDAETALCFSDADKAMIRIEIEQRFGFGSLARFTAYLRLRMSNDQSHHQPQPHAVYFMGRVRQGKEAQELEEEAALCAMR